MNILYVIPSLSMTTGGPAKVAFEYCRELARQGHSVTIFTTEYGLGRDSKTPTNSAIRLEGIIIYYFSLRWPKGYYYSPELAVKLKTELKNFDIVHIHSVWLYPTAIAGYYCRKYNIPYIVKPGGALTLHCRSRKSFKKKIYNMLIEKNNLKNAVGIHYVNKLEENESNPVCVSNYSIVVPNGVEPEDFVVYSQNGDIRKKYPELIDKKVITFLGRIHPIKGIDRLCYAFAQVLEQSKDVHLLIVGPDEGGYKSVIMEILTTLKITDNVTFTGMITGHEKMNVLRSSDIFCLPSYHEAHSMSITEALMCGLPVIISRASKFAEVEKVNAGIVFDSKPNEIASAILKLLGNNKLCKEMGENGKRLIYEKYTWDKVVKQMIIEYRRVLSR